MTLNVANYEGHRNWPKRRELTAQAILECKADVIALQEIRLDPSQPTARESYQNMAEEILCALNAKGSHQGSQLVYQTAMFYPLIWYPLPGSPSQQWEGLGIISAFPIMETGSCFLSKPANCNDRNLRITQYAMLKANGATLSLFNTHFALDQPGLDANARETLAYMERQAIGPSLLVGDLNASPDNPCLDPFKEQGLTDLWQALRPDDPGFTYPASDPEIRIDYCWADEKLSKHVTSIDIVAGCPENGVFASDHLGLVVTLSI